MFNLEARAIIENTGNYDEYEVEDVVDTYKTIQKYIGFRDHRRDKRFIVKFPDIFYYMPDGIEETYADSLFEDFRWEREALIDAALHEKNIDIEEMLHPMYVGHYQAFIVYIPEITRENAIDIAMTVYDEFTYDASKYIDDYMYVVKLLQDLEDNYMDYWIEYIESNDLFPSALVKKMKEKYKSDKERRK